MFGSKPAGSSSNLSSLNLDTTAVNQGTNKRPALFGSLNTSSTATTSAPLFGAAPAPTTSAPSLSFSGFGLGASTTSQAPASTAQAPTTGGGGLFGGLGGGLGASTANTTGGNFGSTLGNTQAGQSNAQQPQPQAGQSSTRDPSAFSSLIERQKKRVRLDKAQQNGRTAQLPELDMDLGDLAARAQSIGRGSIRKKANGADSRAHYVLAGSGVVPGKAYEELQALDSETPLDQPHPPKEAFDVQNGQYFQDLRKKGRKQMMKENMAQVYREVDQFIEDSLGIVFDEQRQRIMEHFGLVARDADDEDAEVSFGKLTGRKSKNTFAETPKGATRSIFGRSALDKSLIGTPGMGGTTSSFFGDERSQQMGNLMKGQSARDLRDKERLFVEKVEKLNQARLNDDNFSVMHQFAEVERSGGVDSPQQLADAYGALTLMVKEKSQGNEIRERQYATTYLDDRAQGMSVVKLRRQLLEGSRSYLESVFYRDLEQMVEKNPREASLGGRPTVINKIRAYIRVRDGRRDLKPDGFELVQFDEGGDYPWVLLFYLLRSGYVNEAHEYASNDNAFLSTDKRFVSYLSQYAKSPDRKLTRKLQDMINGEYQQRSHVAPNFSQDPYRLACYKIVGRCELSRRNLEAVGQGIEDWIWLQFALARETGPMEERAGEEFGLEQICETIAEIGQKHFQKGQTDASGGYGTYFFMQILAGMFEQAVEYLHSHNPASAVHFAIALAYYGLLRVSDYTIAGNELCKSTLLFKTVPTLLTFTVTTTTTGYHQINFVPLVAYYTASFRAALPIAAVDYLALLCLNFDLTPAALGNAQTATSHECLRQLCLETREFARLLGDIRSDGTRIPGAIELRSKLIKLDTHADFLRAVTTQAAAIADERGQVADAVLLFHLSEDYESVISILNRALADACTLDLGESPMELQPLKRRDGGSPTSSNTIEPGPQSSLSLTQSTSSPAELARNMTALYDTNAAYYNKVDKTTRGTNFALLQLLSARAHIEATPPRFMDCLEELNGIGVLPLQAQGSIPVIRSAATAFGALPQLLARCAGASVIWAVRAIGGERERMMQQGGWSGGAGQDSLEDRKEILSTMAKDLMVFAGLVKYRLPGRVYDMLTRVGGEVGGY
jgi:nuclear pore complex protein Nup93